MPLVIVPLASSNGLPVTVVRTSPSFWTQRPVSVPSAAVALAVSVTAAAVLPSGIAGSASSTVTVTSGSVTAWPESDHVPPPSAAMARTCTSYSVPAVRPITVAEVAVPPVSNSVQLSASARL